GYSNGANFAAATMLLHPGAIKRALLFRPSLILLPAQNDDLSGTRVALIMGRDDTLAAVLPSPEEALRDRGTSVQVITVPGVHALSDDDFDAGNDGMRFLFS